MRDCPEFGRVRPVAVVGLNKCPGLARPDPLLFASTPRSEPVDHVEERQSVRRLAVRMPIMLCWVLALVGCQQHWSDSNARGGNGAIGAVGVVDLDAVARRIGRDVEIQETLRRRQTALNEQLSVMQASHQQQLNEAQEQLDERPPGERTSRLNRLQRQASARVREARQRADRDLRTHRRQMVQAFRDVIAPVANQVASERGLSIVVTRNDSVILTFHPSVDITNAVVARMLETKPVAGASGNGKPVSDPAH